MPLYIHVCPCPSTRFEDSISVIDVNNINTFKNKLDKLWVNEEVKFTWRPDVTGFGSHG